MGRFIPLLGIAGYEKIQSLFVLVLNIHIISKGGQGYDGVRKKKGFCCSCKRHTRHQL